MGVLARLLRKLVPTDSRSDLCELPLELGCRNVRKLAPTLLGFVDLSANCLNGLPEGPVGKPGGGLHPVTPGSRLIAQHGEHHFDEFLAIASLGADSFRETLRPTSGVA